MSVSYDKSDNIEVVVMKDVPEMEYHTSANTDTEKNAVIKRVERIVRSSGEYRDYIAFLRQNIGMDACAFFNNVTKQSNRKIKIEVHHTPLTLYDIVSIVLEKFIQTGEELDELMIAEEVTALHYSNNVGLIPLSKTLHEVVHNSEKLIIPMYMIFGDYSKFLRTYEEYWKDNKAIKQKLQNLIKKTEELKADSFDVLETKFTYIKVDGFELPVKIEDEEQVQQELKKSA